MEIDSADDCTTLWINLMSLSCTPKMGKMSNFMLHIFFHNKKYTTHTKIFNVKN